MQTNLYLSNMECYNCKVVIPEGRLRAIPGTKTCVQCSTTEAWYVRPIIEGESSYSEMEIIKDPTAAAEMRRLDRESRDGIPKEKQK